MGLGYDKSGERGRGGDVRVDDPITNLFPRKQAVGNGIMLVGLFPRILRGGGSRRRREGGGKEEGRRRKERESDRKNPRLTVYISRLNKINLAPD